MFTTVNYECKICLPEIVEIGKTKLTAQVLMDGRVKGTVADPVALVKTISPFYDKNNKQN